MFLVSVFGDSLGGTGISDKYKQEEGGGTKGVQALEEGPTFNNSLKDCVCVCVSVCVCVCVC